MKSLSARVTGHLKYLFLALALLILAGLAWYLLQQSGGGPLLMLKTGPEGAMVTDPSMVQFEGRETRWTLNAKSAVRARDDNIVIEQPHLEVYFKDGGKMMVTSRQGAVNNETHAVIFHGEVTATNGPFNVLTTNWLRFDPNRQILYTDQAFRLEGENHQLEGVGFTLDQETQILRVHDKVKVMFNKDRVKENGAWGS
ncbi:MAG: LPS export ABC transporter periplasmic protein LptC [Magnetococcales bacterium]|nr:LPS export ABC transporter periplasmic protein LptC [Magnetococcales bacterium]